MGRKEYNRFKIEFGQVGGRRHETGKKRFQADRFCRRCRWQKRADTESRDHFCIYRFLRADRAAPWRDCVCPFWHFDSTRSRDTTTPPFLESVEEKFRA